MIPRTDNAAQTPGRAWYTACAVMFAAVPAAFVAFALHYRTAGYVAIAVAAALDCFFTGWFVGRASRV